jgi:hypothetical protein
VTKVPEPKQVLIAPTPAQTVESWPAPIQPPTGEAALLEQAFRFFADSRKHLLSRRDKGELSLAELTAGVDPLRWRLHDDLFAYFADLRNGSDGGDSQDALFLKHLKAPIRVAGFSSHGRLMARVLTLGFARSDWADRMLSNRVPRHAGKRKSISFRRFEQLEQETTKLRGLVTRAKVETALTASFGSAIVTPWGGVKAIKRDARPPSTHANGGYAERELFVDLSGKIREQFLTTPFKDAHKLKSTEPQPIKATVQGGPPFTLHIDVHDQIDRIENEILAPRDKPPPMAGEALADLAHLCARYSVAANLAEGVAVGLPWGAALAAVLRAYLVDLIAHLTVIALPGERVQREMDGYLAVAIHELMTKTLAEHVNRTGYVARTADNPVLQGLSAWTVGPFAAGWPAGAPQHALLAGTLTELEKKPVLVRAHKRRHPETGELEPVAEHSTTYEGWHDTWTQYPVVGKDLIWRRGEEATAEGLQPELYCGAHFSAQCHLYVADQILKVAIQDLGLPARTKDYDSGFKDQDKPAADLSVAPRPAPAKGLQLVAGSSLWDGRKPPHITHRDGASFDLRFGADTPKWKFGTWGELIESFMRRKKASDRKAHVIATHHWGVKDGKPALILDQKDKVFAEDLKALIEQQLISVRSFLQQAWNTPPDEEKDAYGELERALEGTPHVLFGAGAQSLVSGVAAILLSGPTQVIHSSPILFARAMRAIREELADLTATPPATPARKALAEALGAEFPPLPHTDFVFFPHNHNDHWHVHYNEDRNIPMTRTRGVQRVDRFLPLWVYLGVDFGPFVDYLEAVVVNPAAPEVHRTRVEGERDDLITLLDGAEPDPDGRKRLRDVFMAFDKDAPASKPADNNNLDFSPEVQTIINDTKQAELDAKAKGYEHVQRLFQELDDELEQLFREPLSGE